MKSPFAPPNVQWSARRVSRELYQVTVVHFQARFPSGCRYLDAMGFAPILHPTPAIHRRLVLIGNHLCRLFRDKPPAHFLKETSLLYDFFHAFHPLHGSPQSVDRDAERIVTVIQYLQNNLAQPATLEDLARLVFVSPNHLSTLFRRHTGHSPIDYLIRLRMEEACRLLRGRRLQVREIADKAGYADTAYFSRHFRQHIGIPPSKYRNKHSMLM
ncbi:MAG: AraC family transcriptional regulator [Verrucomicrobiae bacterium]|nr:AraC family transcriptional regulator [Verrucomicrobiae bacterium]